MIDYLNVGPTPCNEDCAQVGSENYFQRSLKECNSFIGQLRRQFGNEPKGARLYIKSFPHDGFKMGQVIHYHEVVCEFDDEDPEAEDYAFKCENESWQDWDETAKDELGLP